MPAITYEDHSYSLGEGESVLDCLAREGHDIPSSCRSGVCHSCMLRATSGDLPAAAQKGLKDAHRAQGYFLSCCCHPEGDLTVARADDATQKVSARVLRKEALNDRVLRVVLETDEPLDYFPGQFVNFSRPGGLVRSFSLASVPALGDELEFHVALVLGGSMSGWLHNEAAPGDPLELLGPLGNCFYVSGNPEQPLFMLGTGTGLAPLYGIVRDALHQGHSGPIHLFHGALVASDLYLTESLRELDSKHENFTYHACVRDEPGEEWMEQGAVDTLALETISDLKGWKVFLCGNPDLVKQVQRKTFMAGANMKDIHADAFLPAGGG
jgi:CDP-4-dehydro-6-deoxyglucose reductase, E3